MRPTTAHDDKVIDLNVILHPGTVFDHPRDVVSDPSLSLAEKRAILASWASDASAIASCPSLRVPEELKAPVTIDEILEALCALTRGRRILPAENRCGCGRSSGRPHRELLEENWFRPPAIPETTEQDLAGKLLQQVTEWKASRTPARM